MAYFGYLRSGAQGRLERKNCTLRASSDVSDEVRVSLGGIMAPQEDCVEGMVLCFSSHL